MYKVDLISKAYTLTPMKISPRKLLLDPNNPRLITDASQERNYTPKEIRSVDTQQAILEKVNKKEHNVRQLVESIKLIGWNGCFHHVIVKEVAASKSYFVIEGNRRVAALKFLLEHPKDVRTEVKSDIKEIEVMKFQYRKNDLFEEKQVIAALIEMIHIQGEEPWEALSKAYWVYKQYVSELRQKKFKYDQNVAKRIGSGKMSSKVVRKNLIISRVYEQLKSAKYKVEPKHYTLIDLATKTRAVADHYFELDNEECKLSERGVEKFADLILTDSPPIHNPDLFKDFVEVYTNGSDLELSDVENKERDLEEVADKIRHRAKKREFLEDLIKIRQDIQGLVAADFRESEGEKNEIRQIKRLVSIRLLPLARK